MEAEEARPYLVRVPNFLSQLILLVVEVCSGNGLLVCFTLPFSLDYNGLPAAYSQLHVLDHLFLLLQQLPMLDLGTQDGGAGQGTAYVRVASPLSPACLPLTLASEVSGIQRGPQGHGETARTDGRGTAILVTGTKGRQEERKERVTAGSLPTVARGPVSLSKDGGLVSSVITTLTVWL